MPVNIGKLSKDSVTMSADQVQQSGSLRDQKIVVIKNLDDIEKIQNDWQYIKDKFGKATPFSNCEFFKEICSSFGEGTNPHVVVFYEDEKPVALLIGRQTSRPALCLKAVGLRMLSMRCWTIFFDGIITNGKTSSINAAIDYFDSQLRSGEIDSLNLQALHLKDKVVNRIIQSLQDRFKVIRNPELHLYRKIRDIETRLEISNNSSKTKSTFRRKDRKLTKHFDGAVEMLVNTTMAEVNSFIEDAAWITSQTYQATLGSGVTKNSYWKAIIQSLASIGCWRGYLLKSNNLLIAYVLGAVVDEKFTLFATGYSPKYENLSPGTVLLNRVFSSLNDDGVCLVDFGYGDATYKRLHATDIEEDLSLQVYGKRFRASLGWILDYGNSSTVKIAKYTLEKAGLKNMAKRAWRQHLLNRSMCSAHSK